MIKLTHENFIKARDYIYANSDDINRAWFRYNFEDNDTASFLNVLTKYQYENGGFGGLVYEYEYNGSTLFDTSTAFFRYLFYLKEKPTADHPTVQKMMKYLLERYLLDVGGWGDLYESGVNDSAHVPWCGYNGEENTPILDEDERIMKYNPNRHSVLAAFVALYSELVPEDLYRDIIKYPVEKILRYYDEASPLYGQSGKSEWHESDIAVPYNMKGYNQFVTCLKDDKLAKKLKSILLQSPTACMNLDKNKWPHDFEDVACEIVSSPDSFLYPAVISEVDESLDALVIRMNEEGRWRLKWRLGDSEVFDRLQEKYDAHLTMLYLAILNRFGRINDE
jgi:hypothetical protein